jgi:hypothetical protein
MNIIGISAAFSGSREGVLQLLLVLLHISAGFLCAGEWIFRKNKARRRECRA